MINLALLPLLVLVAAQCADNATSPGAGSDGLVPSLAVAQLDPISALEGTPVQFFCGSSSDAEGDPLLCQWDFGNDGLVDAECTTADGNCRWDFDHDGAFEGQRTGSFDYRWPDQGSFEVRLDVSDPEGDHSSTTAAVTVADVAPVITGRSPLFFAVGEVQRINTRFADPGADSAWIFVFDFGDGNVIGPRTAPGPNIGFGQFHAYANPGIYTVTVTVTDKDGVTSRLIREATVVDNDAPVADAGGPYAAAEGATITLSSAGTTDDQSELTYQWELGDGSRSTLANPAKRYSDNGTYAVRLIVTDPARAADTAYTTVEVHNVAPSGTPRVPNVKEGGDYTLTLSGTDPGNFDRPTLEYSFDCGQGAGPTAWGPSSTITCATPPDQGTLTATLTVRDKDGGSSTYVRTVPVANMPPTVTLTPVGSTTIVVGATMQMQASFTDPGTADGPFAYRLNWGDGSSTTASTPVQMPTPTILSHGYTRAGTFAVIMTVTDKDGATRGSTRTTITVTP
jgi:PKD repeat protein